MKDTAKVPRLFMIGLIFLCLYGDDRLLADESYSHAATLVNKPVAQTEVQAEAQVERSFPVAVTSELEGLVGDPFDAYPTSRLESSVTAPAPDVASSDEAQSCADFDPVANPGQILDILTQASKSSCMQVNGEKVCTPVDALYGIWRIESGEVDGGGGGGNGTCDVMTQLYIRCAVGKACGHQRAMKKMAGRFGWNLNRMTCSCGTSTMNNQTNNFGGCCGPFQFSGAEVVQNAMDHGYDPMTFCGGAKIVAIELRDYYIRFRKEGSSEKNSWRRAISRYAGVDIAGYYWARARQHWNTFHAWSSKGQQTLRDNLAAEASSSVQYHLKRRARK